MKRIDWNCKLLPGFPDQTASVETAVEALQILHDQTGITEFAFFPKYDPATDSQTIFQFHANAALTGLQSRLPFAAKLFVRPTVYLRSEIPENNVLRHFRIPKTNYVAFSLPITANEDTETVLAKFLRHSPYHVLLTDAQLLPIFYPNDVLERIANLPGIALQVSYQSLFLPNFTVFLRKLLQKGVPIVLGSGVNSPERASKISFDELSEALKENFTKSEAERLLNAGLPRGSLS